MTFWRRLRDEEDGQALLYGVGVVVITMTLFYGAIDIGLLVLGKIQAQGAADAAAMSASGLKVSVHNTRSLAYRAASGQIGLTRMALVQATGLALNGILDPSEKNKKAFSEAISKAHHHRDSVEMLHTGIKNYNAWLIQNDTATGAVKKAAEIGYLGNIGVLGTMNASNLRLIKQNDAMAEFSASSPMIGGTTFAEEVVGTGSGGKSHVMVEPKVNALGASFLAYGAQSALSASATAGPVDAAKAYGGSLKALKLYGVNFYTIRLLAIGGAGSKP